MASRWVRWLRGLLGLAIVGYAVRLLIQNWESVRTAPLEWRLRPLPVIASIVLVVATYAILVEAWRRMVAGWGSAITFWPAARVWVLSSMGKYLPGKIWTIAGMAVLGREAGVPAWVATASAIVLQIASIGTGALVVVLSGSGAVAEMGPGTGMLLLALAAAAVASLAVLLWPKALESLVRRVGRISEFRAPAAAPIVVGVVLNAVAWILYGLALYWLAAGIFPSPGLTVPQAIGAFTASYLAGFLFLLAPGGLGVREVVFVLVTQSTLGPTQALALAAVSRLGMTAADLLAAAPFVLFRQRPRDQT